MKGSEFGAVSGLGRNIRFRIGIAIINIYSCA